MSATQLLLRRLLEQAGGAAGPGYVLVIDGEGLEDLPAEFRTPQETYTVHRVSTEIGLRHLLWKAGGAPLIVVLPEEVVGRVQKAPDLLRRARNQRVHALSANDVLEVVLGVRVYGAESPSIQELALEHLDKLSAALSQRTLPTVVDRRLLKELLIDASVGEQVRSRTPAELLAAWVREPPQWSEAVSELVRGELPTMHGDEGRLLAWALEEPEVRLRLLVVHGAVLTVQAVDLAKSAWGPLWGAAAEPAVGLERRVLRRTLTAMVEGALRVLGDEAARLLAEADRVGRETLTSSQLQTSPVLPLAFADRCHTLARQAADGRAISADDIEWLRAHRAAGLYRGEMAVLDGIARLSRYLDAPRAARVEVLEQVQDYLRDGAFADLAVTRLRRALAGSGKYHAEAQTVMAAVRQRRDDDNERFAKALAAGYEAALHREGFTPLHRVFKRVVAPVWQQDAKARLYLVVLDGCSYAVFLELLHALSQDQTFPLGIAPDAEGRVAGRPALAPLPTVTSHARGALFLGELPEDPLVAETVFRDRDEAKTDKARFNQNQALGGRSRKLFLKGDLGDGGQALLRALADEAIDVVAAVFNAVDDQIGSSNTGATVRLRPGEIMGLTPSLRAAIEAGRRVLVTADHGHSPYVDRSLRVGSGSAPRYLALGEGEAAPEGFAEIDLGGLGGPPERRAFAWRCGAYLGGPQVGFHGGCGLEEMVVPLAWLERDGLHADEPAWWFARGGQPEARLEPPPEVRPEPPRPEPAPQAPPRRAPAPQLSLFEPADKAGGLGLPEALLERLSADERAALVLLKENASARASELAERLKKSPMRLNGLMRKLRMTMHAEGIVMFTDEVLPSGETQYRFQPVARRGEGG